MSVECMRPNAGFSIDFTMCPSLSVMITCMFSMILQHVTCNLIVYGDVDGILSAEAGAEAGQVELCNIECPLAPVTQHSPEYLFTMTDNGLYDIFYICRLQIGRYCLVWRRLPATSYNRQASALHGHCSISAATACVSSSTLHGVLAEATANPIVSANGNGSSSIHIECIHIKRFPPLQGLQMQQKDSLTSNNNNPFPLPTSPSNTPHLSSLTVWCYWTLPELTSCCCVYAAPCTRRFSGDTQRRRGACACEEWVDSRACMRGRRSSEHS